MTEQNIVNIELNLYQDTFIFAEERFAGLLGAVGTGKTFAFLFKAWDFCQNNPSSLGLIIRKEYTDLRDSTIQDFEKYFGVKINQSKKEYEFANGAKIMFRHGDMNDINVLKNINLSFFGIEQAEEYETEEVFDFLRDRLRRKGSKRWAMIIANANGHNWAWKRFLHGAKVTTVNSETGEYEYRKDGYICCTANSFANEHNLPADFIADLKKMETEAPEHYYQYVMNSFEYTNADDFLFAQQDFEPKIGGKATSQRIAALDVARFGKDKSVFKIIEYFGSQQWKEVYSESWQRKPITYTTGRSLELMKEKGCSTLVVDGDGIGCGAVDTLRESRYQIIEYRGGLNPCVDYYNNRARDYFSLKDAIQKGYLDITHEETKESLLTIKYMYQGNKQKRIVGKNEMRAKGYNSPDDADAIMMAYSGAKYFDFNDGSSNEVMYIDNDFDPFD